ncbi:MAG: isoprenyl transferase [Oscillospiraceae bacterium]|jgi:undecaprenyl diphosphate synthase|nr:isoprenyl transferase [Oscillospiraceae bacterium]
MRSKFNLKSNPPGHVAIIMDGNGRWAKERLMTRSLGHKFGAENFKSITRYCGSLGIKYLTVFAFSTENWKRSSKEVDFIMGLFEEYLNKSLEKFLHENFRVIFLGDKNGFPSKIRDLINRAENETQKCTGMVLNIAANYGSKAEITSAVKVIAQKVKNDQISIDEIDETLISNNLYTSNQPEVDLVIRTGGEKRVSNFLFWQSAYAEYIFTDVLWPDFDSKCMDRALKEFSSRKRRFGGMTVDS